MTKEEKYKMLAYTTDTLLNDPFYEKSKNIDSE